jgi:hypothetical protein
MKRLLFMLATITISFILIFSVVYGDVYHGKVTFTIPAASTNSPNYSWTPDFTIPSGYLYIETFANLANPTGLTEQYTVKPSASSSNVGYMPIDGVTRTKYPSMAAYYGTTYKASAYKFDIALTIKVTGKISFYSLNNS